MQNKLKLTPSQKEALTKLATHTGLMRWDELKAPGPTLARLSDLQMVKRGKLGSVSAWSITDAGRAALA